MKDSQTITEEFHIVDGRLCAAGVGEGRHGVRRVGVAGVAVGWVSGGGLDEVLMMKS